MARDTATPLHRPGTVLLDGVDGAARSHLLFTTPRRVLTARAPGEVPALLAALNDETLQGRYVAGYLAYEAGYAFEDIAPVAPGALPLAWFGVYDVPERLGDEALDRLFDDVEKEPFAVRNVHLAIDRAAYRNKIAAVRRHIRAGDVYQINFTGRIHFELDGSPPALYGALRRRQRVPYGAFLHTGDAHVLCRSPELFFRRDGDRLATRPMKGTVHRGRTLAEDDALRRWLASDPKNRAENLMIVDLLRNDLARCCRVGSVHVPALFTTEPYETLIQMTSTVEGTLEPGNGYAEIFRALFPCGSVTGAPKIRAMQRIHALEDAPRGVYCGAIGYAGPDRQAVFNVAIRTVVLHDGHGVMGTGSGVVWDSDADAEYDECRLKARFLIEATHTPSGRSGFQLIETMRATDGTIPLLDLHAERLRASAVYFGFAFDDAAFRGQAAEVVRGLPAGPHKVRALLDRAGDLSVSTSLLDAFGGYRRVVVAEERVDAQDVFFFHKTTRRAFYEDAYRRAQDAGFDEVLFRNERGEVTEGSRTNVFVQRGDALYTPPVACGLLGGVYRRHVLATRPNASERVLSLEDVLEADAVFLCNAVRGWQRVEAVITPEVEWM